MVNQIKVLPKLSVEHRRKELAERFSPWQRKTVAEHVKAMCERYRERDYMYMGGETYTYGDVWNEAIMIAKGMMALGVKRRDHVAVLMDNHPTYPAFMFAASIVGAVFVPINSMLAKDEVAYILNQSDARYLFVQQSGRTREHGIAVSELLQDSSFLQNSRLESVVCLEDVRIGGVSPGFLLWGDFVRAALDVSDEQFTARFGASVYPDEVMMILYTSGSTGRPKGVMLTEDMLVRSAYSTCYSRAIEEGRVTFAPLPFYHCFAIVESILAMTFVGGAFIEAMGVSPLESLELMERYRANDFLCVPTTLVPVVDHPRVGDFDLSHLFAMWCGAAAAPIPVWERAIDVFGLTEIITGYGQTEVASSGVTTEIGIGLDVITRRVGRPKLGGGAGAPEFAGRVVEYKTVDIDTGEDLLPGQVGELVVRGVTVSHGYYNKPEETAEAIDKDGWLRTGDVGMVHDDGYLSVLGRSKEMFKVSGELVSPREIENVLYDHPAVHEVQVIGVADVLTGEIPAAFVELKDGFTVANDVSSDEGAEVRVLRRKDLTAYCAEHLARFKVPRHVWFVTEAEWPLTASGKIQKFTLVEMAKARLMRGGKG